MGVPDGEAYDGSSVPVAGRVTALAVDAGGSSIYLGSAGGGVWKRDLRKRYWAPLSDHEPTLAIGALIAHATKPGWLVAGTGDANQAYVFQRVLGDRRISGDRGLGVLLSTNGGRTWSLRGRNELKGAAFSELAPHPRSHDLVLAATTTGLFRSLDFGLNWQRLAIEDSGTIDGYSAITSVAISKSGRAFAARWGGAVFISDDIGAFRPKWSRATGGLPLSNVSRVALATSPADPTVVIALMADLDGRLRGLYISTNLGQTWQRIPSTPDVLTGQGTVTMLAAAHPDVPGLLFVGGSGDRQTMKSDLFAGLYQSSGWSFAPLAREAHVDVHAMTFDSRNRMHFWIGTDGGVWETFDGGTSWHATNEGLRNLQMVSLSQNGAARDVIIVGTQDNGTLLYAGGRWTHVDNGDGGAVAFDPAHPNSVYNLFAPFKIGLSTTGGSRGSFTTFEPKESNVRSTFMAPFALAPGETTSIALGLNKLFLTNDTQHSWAAISDDVAASAADGTRAFSALHFVHSNLLYAGASDGRLWRFSRFNSRWYSTEISGHGNANPSSGAFISSIDVRQGGIDTVVLATTGGHNEPLYRVLVPGDNNRGDAPPKRLEASWSSLSGAGPVRISGLQGYAVSFGKHRDPRTLPLYVGTDAGIFISRDAGEHWQPFNDGLPNVSVFAIEEHPSAPIIRAATYGRGLWEHSTTCADTPPTGPNGKRN